MLKKYILSHTRDEHTFYALEALQWLRECDGAGVL